MAYSAYESHRGSCEQCTRYEASAARERRGFAGDPQAGMCMRGYKLLQGDRQPRPPPEAKPLKYTLNEKARGAFKRMTREHEDREARQDEEDVRALLEETTRRFYEGLRQGKGGQEFVGEKDG